MDKLIIQGGVPASRARSAFRGENAAAPAHVRGVAQSEQLTLSNVPHLRDVSTMLRLLAQMGVESLPRLTLGPVLRAERVFRSARSLRPGERPCALRFWFSGRCWRAAASSSVAPRAAPSGPTGGLARQGC